MPIRFYIAPQTGDGSYLNPYKSKVYNYLDFTEEGTIVSEVDEPRKRISLAFVKTSIARHAAIVADTDIYAVSPLMDDEDASTPLELALSNLPNLSAVKTKLENHGISTEWMTDSNSIRDAMRYIIRLFSIAQRLYGKQNFDALEIFSRGLTTQVKNIPPVTRNTISNWMQERGLAIGWINANTTVREILHFVITNLGFGKFRIKGIEF